MNSRAEGAAAGAWNKNPVPLCADVLPVFRHDFAARDRHDGKALKTPALVNGIVLPPVKVLEADGSLGARIDDGDIGITADRHRPFTRIETEDFSRVHARNFHQTIDAELSLGHSFGIEEWNAHFDT